MTATMRAVVLDTPGPPEALRIRELPVPEPRPGWVLIRVKAFGINRSELHTRLGLAQGVTFPRVLGIEATGVVAAAPGGEFEEGQQVAAMMGGMGRTFDGGYAEFTSVPVAQVIPFRSELDWATLGAIPEMLQTAHGSLTVGLDAQPGQTLLIRGGTSSVGMAAAIPAKDRGLTVLSTTRQPDRVAALEAIGVDHVFLDDGHIAAQARAIVPDASRPRSSSSAPTHSPTPCAPPRPSCTAAWSRGPASGHTRRRERTHRAAAATPTSCCVRRLPMREARD